MIVCYVSVVSSMGMGSIRSIVYQLSFVISTGFAYVRFVALRVLRFLLFLMEAKV